MKRKKKKQKKMMVGIAIVAAVGSVDISADQSTDIYQGPDQ